MAAGVSDGALIIDTGLNNSGFIRDANQFRRAVDGLKGSVDRVGKSLAGGADGYLRTINQASGVTRKLDAQIKQLEREAARLQQSMSAGGYSDSYNALSDSISKAEAEIEKLQAKQQEWADMGIAPDSAPFEELDQQIFDLMDSIESLKAKQAEMRASGDALAPGMDQMKADYAELQQQLEALKAQRDRTLSTPPGWDKMATVTGAVADAMNRIKTAAATAMYALQHPLEALNRGFAALIGGAIRAASAIAKMAGRGAVTFLRQMAEGARNAAIQFAKLAANAVRVAATNLGKGFKTLGQGILAAGKWMLGLNHSAGEASNGFKRGLWAILKYGLGIRSLYFLFRKVRTAISEGLGEIAKRNPAVNQQLNAMKSALNGLKGSLGAAFAPIFTAVAPALTYLINMLTSAINAIGAFMAALTGQKTYQKAVAGISGAGDATSSAGNAADAAADSYEDLKRELAGFDDLDVLGSKDSGSGGGSSGSGGGSGGGAGISYETEEISSGITDFIGKVKEMWENADYEGIGRAIAGTINSAFEKAKDWISWDNLGATITEAVNGITGIFNGLVDGVNWTLIGQTFGEGVNTLVNTCNLLLTGIDWKNLGKSIATGLNGLVDTVKWDNLGQLFANKLNALIGVISGAVTNFKWGDAGTAFATAVNGLLDTVDWTALGTALSSSLGGALEAVSSAVDGIKWAQIGYAFAARINGIFDLNWDYVSSTITKSLNGALEAISTAVDNVKWAQIGYAFASGINGIINLNWNNVSSTITKSLNGALEAISTAVNNVKWAQIGYAFASGINGIINLNWNNVSSTITKSLNGALEAISTAVNNVKWAQIGYAFASGINGIINLNWNNVSSTITKSLNGALEAIGTAIEGIKWGQIGYDFASGLNGLISGINWEYLGTTASNGIAKPLEAIKNAVTTFSFGDAAKDFADAVNAFFSNEQMWADAGTIVSESIKGMFTWGADFLNNLDVDQIAKDIKVAVSKIDWPGIADAMWKFLKAAITGLGKGLADLFSPIQEEADDYEIVIGATGEVYFVPKPGEGLHTEGDHWELDEEVNADASVTPTKSDNWEQEWDELVGDEIPVAVDPTLPDNAGKVIEDEWAAQDPDLKTDVDATLKPTNTPGTVFDVSKVLNFLGTLGKKDSNQTPGILFAVGTALAFLGTLGKKDNNQTPGILFDVATALGFKGTLSKADNNQTPGILFNVGTVLAFLGTLSRRNKDDDSPKSVFNSGTVLGFLGTLARRDKDNDSPKAVFNSDTVLGFLGTLARRDKDGDSPKSVFNSDTVLGFLGTLSRRNKDDDSPKSVFNVGTVLGFLGSLSRKSQKNDSPGKVFDVSKVLGFLGRLKRKDDKQKPSYVFKTSTILQFLGKLKAKNKTSDVFDTAITVTATLSSVIKGLGDFAKSVAKKVNDELKKLTGNAEGGVISNGGHLRRFAAGGIISGGMARYLSGVPHYAGGTTRAHGTVFVAGEAGPEIMGHINGRTEILNKSQLAQTMYSAVLAAMTQAVSALGTFLSGQLANCTNAIVKTIGNRVQGTGNREGWGFAGLNYHAPVMASGTVLPYDVAAQIARTGMDIQNTLDTNNEDLIQTIISVIGAQTSAIVAAVQNSGNREQGTGNRIGGGLTPQQMIDDINRRTQMFGGSPLLD